MKKASQPSAARELAAFSLPLIMSGILQQLYSWADAFIVGHVEGEMALAAVGATSSISYFLINTILGFTLGLSIMGAQHFGRRDTGAVERILHCFLPVLLSVYAGLALLAFALASPILRAMNTPQDIFSMALSYLKIIFTGIPFLACYNLFAALLRAVGNTKAAFYAVLLSSALNVALDVLFISIFGWGVSGAAFATVLSQLAMTVFIVVYSMRRYSYLIFRWNRAAFSRSFLLQGLRFSVPPTVQNSVTSLGNLVLQNFMNGFGSTTVLAITTAYRVDSMMLLPVINLGAAISSMTARAKGAADDDKIRRCFSSGLALMIAVSGVLSIVMFLFGAEFVAIFGVTGEALAIGRQFFRDLSIFYTLFGVAMVLRSALEGVGDITCCSLIGIGMLGVRILFSYLLRPVLANRTIAIAEGIAWVLMLLALMARTAYQHRKKKKPPMTGRELWNAFFKGTSKPDDFHYKAWSFGTDADSLAHLVAIGTKTATASAYPLYQLEDEPLPLTGAYSVILDAKNHAVCIIRTTKVTIVPFHEVTAEHAFKEGEGDRSLAFWRAAHEKFFAECLHEAGLTFTPDMKVVCEEFTVVYKP